jgi:hypothetical protein
MITTPVEKSRAKSYYLGPQRHGEDNRSLGNHSVRIDQKKRSQSKMKRDKHKSTEKDTTLNGSKFFRNPKSAKKDKDKSLSKSMNKSTSKHLKSPHRARHPDLDEDPRPRAHSQKQKLGAAKKSHQGSYMIGAESGVDWPLEPRYKGEGGKIRSALRRR